MAERAYGDESSIAAFATPLTQSALTLIRCSGKDSIECAAAVFSAPGKLLAAAGNTVLHGWILAPAAGSGKGPAAKIDEVLVSVFRSPRSYTGEDSLDISCHGGIAAGRAVMDALLAAGFKEALAGEFTFRAFMNGKLDLTRSESVMELVSAKTNEGRRRALGRLLGALEKEINEIKKLLTRALASAEIFLDYSEDEIGADSDEAEGRFRGFAETGEALERIKKLLASWTRERIYQDGILAVIAGRPNAGKSSLFNALLREERSIVTEIAGTTRDWIEAWVSIEGIPVRLVDTAGLRDTAESIEKIGVERSRELLHEADLVLYVINGAEGPGPGDLALLGECAEKRRLVIWNKADLAPMPAGFYIAPNEQAPSFAAPGTAGGGAIGVSAKTGEGIEALGRAIAALAGDPRDAAFPAGPEAAALGSSRQKALMDTARAALEEALELSGRGEPLDLIAPLLREVLNALGEITGEVSTDGILEEMFSRFCVGK
jgi:tRNA modification GTPase